MRNKKHLIFSMIMAVCFSLKSYEFGQDIIEKNNWEQISERGQLRVLVSPSRTNFFISDNTLHGFEYEMLELFKKQMQRSNKKFTINYIPVPHDQLIPRLITGHGDLAVALLTITPERSKLVDFTQPYFTKVKEVLVAHTSAPHIDSLNALSGKTILVTGGSPYINSLIQINKFLTLQELLPIKIKTLKGGSSEDVLELINLKVYDYCVVDDTLAKLWINNLKHIKINDKLAIGLNKKYAWAIRKNSPKLKTKLDSFIKNHAKGSLIGNIIFKKYYKNNNWLKHSLMHEFHYQNPYYKIFKQAGKIYNLDAVFLSAVAFQESRFKPNIKSHMGAQGLMQLMPATAREMGVNDPLDPKQNIMGGSKYLHKLIKAFAQEKQLLSSERVNFALAAYNAGSANLRHWRKKAKAAGYDPDIWFNNVDKFAPNETYIYVFTINRNIHLVKLYKTTLIEKENAKKALADAIK